MVWILISNNGFKVIADIWRLKGNLAVPLLTKNIKRFQWEHKN
jgi:hypothetical protein